MSEHRFFFALCAGSVTALLAYGMAPEPKLFAAFVAAFITAGFVVVVGYAAARVDGPKIRRTPDRVDRLGGRPAMGAVTHRSVARSGEED